MSTKTDIRWWWWLLSVFTNFFIGCLWAEIVTAIVWQKLVKSWQAPIFCRRQYLWRFLHSGLVQISRYSAGESPPIKAGWPVATATWWLNMESTTSSGRSRRTSERFWRSQLLRTLMGQKTVRRCFWACANILSPRFCQRQYFVDANILSTGIFCWH